AADWANALANLPDSARAFPMVLEEKCELETEISVIVGRHPTLGTFIFPAVENIHVNGILDTTLFPARLPYELCEKARAVAEKIADSWDVFGLLCVEFFVVRRNGEHALLVNEVAPRPHNSGHVTRRSMSRSQFDILAQILLDLPFVSQQVSPDRTWAMWNTLGDLWSSHSAAWPAELLAHSAVCEAMLYGKPGVRAGRKMGHVILSAPNHAALTKNIDHLRSTFTNKKGGHG
ncbi:ATP-grasp domain-containing protein, partial [bacterium]|nr:ATP-grasp domain-containing protein [bacterium]